MEIIKNKLRESIICHDIKAVRQIIFSYPQLLNCRLDNNETPASLATQSGTFEILKFLVQAGADINDIEELPPLHVAVKEHNTEVVEYLLSHGADIDILNADLDDALHLAVQNEDIQMVRLLVSKGIDINKKQDIHPLFTAILHNIKPNYEIVDYLLQNGADVNTSDSDRGLTPLFVALSQNDIFLIKLILKYKPSIDATDANNFSAIYYACHFGDIRTVKILIENGFIPDFAQVCSCKDNEIIRYILLNCYVDSNIETGLSPLIVAIHQNNIEIIKLLLNLGEDPNAKTSYDNETCLHFAVSKKSFEITRLLLSYGALTEVFTRAKHITPLYQAVLQNSMDLVNILISYGADVNVQKSNGATPLIIALENNNTEMACKLITEGANLNYELDGGINLLHYFAYHGNSKIITFLLQYDFDINAQTHNGETALFMAVYQQQYNVAKILISHGAEIDVGNIKSPFFYAVYYGNISFVKYLISHGCDYSREINNHTPLALACINGHLDIIKLLVYLGENINKKTTDGNILINEAIVADQYEVVKFLLRNGADLNLKNVGEFLPIHYALRSKDPKIANIIIHNDSNIESIDLHGYTPLHIACYNNNVDIVKYIINKNAGIQNFDNYRETPLFVACLNNSVEAAKILLECHVNQYIVNSEGRSIHNLELSDEMRNLLEQYS